MSALEAAGRSTEWDNLPLGALPSLWSFANLSTVQARAVTQLSPLKSLPRLFPFASSRTTVLSPHKFERTRVHPPPPPASSSLSQPCSPSFTPAYGDPFSTHCQTPSHPVICPSYPKTPAASCSLYKSLTASFRLHRWRPRI